MYKLEGPNDHAKHGGSHLSPRSAIGQLEIIAGAQCTQHMTELNGILHSPLA